MYEYFENTFCNCIKSKVYSVHCENPSFPNISVEKKTIRR